MAGPNSNFQAIILAAGIGNRLKPLTNHMPKPLIPFFGTTPFALAHSMLLKSGIGSIGANSHHLSKFIETAAANLPGSPVKVSVEQPDILGTAGLFNPFAKWLLAKNVILYNADIISDISIDSLCKTHLDSGAAATMVLLTSAIEGKTPVFVDSEDWIVGIGTVDSSFKGSRSSLRQASFTGVHALSDLFYRKIPKSGPSESIPIYRSFISEGRKIKAHLHSGYWFDIGDPASLFDAYRQVGFDASSVTAKLRQERALGLELIGSLVRTDEVLVAGKRSIRGGCWISPGVNLPEAFHLERTIALPGAVIAPGERVLDEIRGYGERIDLSID